MSQRFFLSIFVSLVAAKALARETRAEKAAALTALRQLLVELEDLAAADAVLPQNHKSTLTEHFKVAGRHFPEPAKADLAKILRRLETHAEPNATKNEDESLLARDRLLQVSRIETAPALTPAREKAAATYREQCESCHGARGEGDGVLTPKMQIKPKSFASLQQTHATPFRYLNILLLGRPETVMPSYVAKHDLEALWGLAFYAAALPYTDNVGSKAQKITESMWNSWTQKGLSLSLLATMTDQQLLIWIKKVDSLAEKDAAYALSLLKILRYQAPFKQNLPRGEQR